MNAKEQVITELKVPALTDRERMVVALANSGYCVWVEERSSREISWQTEHWVCFAKAVKEEG